MENNGKGYPEQPHLHTKAPYPHSNLTCPANPAQAIRDAQADPRKTLLGVGQGIASLITLTKPDFVWIDMEHAMFNNTELQDAIHAIYHHFEGKSLAVFRVPKNDEKTLIVSLDSGTSVIGFPHIESAEHIKEKIKEVYYLPLGHRGFSPWTFTPGVTDESLYLDDGFNFKSSNEHIVVVAQNESVKALENVEEIAAVEGVGAPVFGLVDFTQEAGIRLKFGGIPDPRFLEVMGKFTAAAQKYNKPILGTAQSLEQTPMLVKGGHRVICVSVNVWGLQGMVYGHVKGGRAILEKEFGSSDAEKTEKSTNSTS